MCLASACNQVDAAVVHIDNERQEKIQVEEARSQFKDIIRKSKSISSRGIEASAVSQNNPNFKFNEYKESQVNNEEVFCGNVCYVCGELLKDNHTHETVALETEIAIPETESIIIEESEIIVEDNSLAQYVGTYEITAYMWTGNPMANGEWPYVGCVASCDFPIGTVLYIEGFGEYVVKDVCPTSGVIDIYMETYEACATIGRQTANVYIK